VGSDDCGCDMVDISMKQKWIDAFMDTAERFAQLSSARRLHVGAIIVKDERIISIGYNGMPSGWDNNCEDEIGNVLDDNGNIVETRLKSKPEVLHAETNAIAKLAKSNESGLGATMFITHAPCLDCAKLIYQSGIGSVLYRNSYRNDDGIDFLQKCNIEVKNTLLKSKTEV
jgi:dCMP deaminase